MEVDGTNCAFASAPAIANQFANMSGTFTGALAPGTLAAPTGGTTGTGTLTVMQSSSAGADGQFAATGTLNYQIGTCTGSFPLTGNVSGVGMILAGISGSPPNLQNVSVITTTNATATTISVADAEITPAPCSTSSTSYANYFGTLSRQ
jgi:hypothetical protein